MNTKRRKELAALLDRVQLVQIAVENLHNCDSIQTDLEAVLGDERDTFDLLTTAAQADQQHIIDNLELAFEKLGEIAETITSLTDNLQETVTALRAVKDAN